VYKSHRNIKFKIKYIVLFIVFQIIFLGIMMPILICHGPFDNVKRTFVGTAMTTQSHKWAAELFLSDEDIHKIIGDSIKMGKEINIERNNIKHLDYIQLDKNNNDNFIELYEIKDKKFCGKVIIVKNPKKVKVGYTKKIGKEGMITSKLAYEYGAIAAVNGGGFRGNSSGLSWAGTGGIPSGIIISDGKIIYNDVKDDNMKIDTMAITEKGHLLVGKYSVDELIKLGVDSAISFGPPLIINGVKAINKGDGGWGIAPRTAIGQRKDGAVILLVIDGRQIKSIGATLKEVQDILYEFGAVNATNLDGGFSTTMYYDGEVISNPPDILGERAVPSIVYVED
jgi:exopolysaccharide biosynthesis protein